MRDFDAKWIYALAGAAILFTAVFASFSVIRYNERASECEKRGGAYVQTRDITMCLDKKAFK